METKKYTISVHGCDDSTIIHEELTKEELEFLRHIQSKVNETSTYGCMPTIEIELYKEDQPMELNIKDFDELESYFRKKAQHVEELESENTELTIENRKLRQEIDRLKRSQVEYINQQLNGKKPPAETDSQVRNMINTESIPQIFKGRR